MFSSNIILFYCNNHVIAMYGMLINSMFVYNNMVSNNIDLFSRNNEIIFHKILLFSRNYRMFDKILSHNNEMLSRSKEVFSKKQDVFSERSLHTQSGLSFRFFRRTIYFFER